MELPSTQLPSVATKIPDGTKPESRVTRFTRWLDNDRILEEVYFLPYVDILLTQLALETLVVVMDGSVVGRGCLALMFHVVYKGRALPLAWRVRHSPKGHGPEVLHIAMVELMSTVIPARAKVVFLGDGEFDGTALQDTLRAVGWTYVCRTAMSTTATWEGEPLPRRARRVSPAGEAHCVIRGLGHPRGVWSHHGAVLLGQGYQEPWYLVNNLATAEEACRVYPGLPHRDFFLRPEKSRVPYSAVAYIRPAASFSVINSGVFSVYLDCLFRLIR